MRSNHSLSSARAGTSCARALLLTLGLSVAGLAACSEDDPAAATEEEAAAETDEAAAEGGAAAEGEAPAEGAAGAAGLNAEPAPGAPPAGSDDAAKPVRRFLQVEGTVTMDGAPATVDAAIPETAKIVTGKDGRAVITLEPGGIIEIRKGSTVEVGKSERKDKSLKLALGTLWSFVPNGSSYEVVTDNAVAGVRGTVFYMEAQGPKKTYLCACDGEIDLVGANPKLNKPLKSSMEHKAFMIMTKGKKQVARKAKRLNHTDEQKDALLPLMGQGG